MPLPSPCPDARELQRILHGQPSDSDTERLARHLEECGRCADAVDRLLDREGLVLALRGEPQPAPRAEDATVHRLVTCLRCLRPDGAAGDTADRSPTPAPSAPSRASAADLGFPLAPPEGPDEIGRLGPYGILRLLGSGGMGIVFAARQVHPGRVVALKMLPSGPASGWQRLARFHGETEVVARLQHGNIVPVYEVGEYDGRPYYTMEYLDGGSLAGRLAAAPLAPRAAAELAQTLARAVHFAHERGFVHRDLKPANVLLAADGTPKIADFGLAKQLGEHAGDPAAPYRTESGAILGTPGYMAPEQAEGKKEVGPAADVYALGAILYECLTGRPPFKAATVLETLDQVRGQEPVPISRLQPRVPRDLETVCLKCLAKEPARRYGSAAALADDLGRFLRGEPIRARPVSRRERLWKWAKRKPALAALIAASAAALLLLAAGVAVHNAQLQWQVHRAEESETKARTNEAAALKQRRRADDNYHEARKTIEQMLDRLQRQGLADTPQLNELRQQQLEDALAFYQGALGGQDDPDPAVRFDAALAYQRTGDLQQVLGRRGPAAANLRQAVALLEQLTAEHPKTPDYEAHLADAYNHLGLALGDANGQSALYYHKALDLFEGLVQAHPDNQEWQNHLAMTHHQLGAFAQSGGRQAEAETHYDRAVAIRTRLLREQPQDEKLRFGLAQDYENLGLMYAAGGRLDEAALPAVAASTLGLLGSPSGLGPLLAASALFSGRADKAATAFREVEALLGPLIGHSPDGEAYALVLAGGYVNWTYAPGATDRPHEMLPRLDRAVGLAEDVLRREPHYDLARLTAHHAHARRAEFYQVQGHWPEAVTEWDRVVALDQDSERWADRVHRAGALAQAGNHARAAAEAQALAADPAVSADGQYDLASAYAVSIRAARSDARLPSAERPRLAEHYAAHAVALLRKLQGRGYFKNAAHVGWLSGDPEWQPLRGREDFQQLLDELKSK
jgi:serine/threonine protein kinase